MHPLVPYLKRNAAGIGLTLHQLLTIERDLNEVAALREENAALKIQLAEAPADRTPKRAVRESAT